VNRLLFPLEFSKLFRLASLRFSALLLLLLALLWAYAPGIFDVYGVFLVSGWQVPSLSLLSGMEFLFPLVVATVSAELLGLEISQGTLRSTLLRPVTRWRWLAAKLGAAALLPFVLLLFVLLVSLLAGIPYGYGDFQGGTGLGAFGLAGAGQTLAGEALREVLQAYAVAAFSLVPVSMLAVLLTAVFMNAAGGALATLGVIIVSGLLNVFTALTPYLPSTQLDAYMLSGADLVRPLLLSAVWAGLFAAAALRVFTRKDF